jgi:hypothetical protein
MPFTRVRFFAGQMLSAKDFETEQAYQLEKRRLHNRLLHGPGVVSGLEVSLDGTSVVVSPGFALDRLGNELLVEQPVRVPARRNAKDCLVTIRYTETLADPVPAPNGSEYSRVAEGFAIEICETPDKHAIVLARLIATGGEWVSVLAGN